MLNRGLEARKGLYNSRYYTPTNKLSQPTCHQQGTDAFILAEALQSSHASSENTPRHSEQHVHVISGSIMARGRVRRWGVQQLNRAFPCRAHSAMMTSHYLLPASFQGAAVILYHLRCGACSFVAVTLIVILPGTPRPSFGFQVPCES